MDDLSFYTTDQLLDEVLKRETFNGIVISNNKEYRGGKHLTEKLSLLASRRLNRNEVALMVYSVLDSLSRT